MSKTMKLGPSDSTANPKPKRKRLRNLRLLLLMVKFIVLNLWSKVFAKLKRSASRIDIPKSRKEKTMSNPKVKITQNVPPMPMGDDPIQSEVTDSPSSPSIGSEKIDAVSEELAGDLIALPFDAWHLFNDAVEPLSEVEKARLAGPFARIMEKYGMGKIAKDEVLFGFYLTAIMYGRVKAAQEAKRQRKLIEGSTPAKPIVEH
jgi:hypothetical protein